MCLLVSRDVQKCASRFKKGKYMTRNISKANHNYSFECEKCKIRIEGWINIVNCQERYYVEDFRLKYCPNCGEIVESDS